MLYRVYLDTKITQVQSIIDTKAPYNGATYKTYAALVFQTANITVNSYRVGQCRPHYYATTWTSTGISGQSLCPVVINCAVGLKSKVGFFFHFHFTSLHFFTFTHKHGGRRSIAGIKESFEGYRPPTPMVIKEIPFKFSTCKTSAGVIKEIHYKMQHVQD